MFSSVRSASSPVPPSSKAAPTASAPPPLSLDSFDAAMRTPVRIGEVPGGTQTTALGRILASGRPTQIAAALRTTTPLDVLAVVSARLEGLLPTATGPTRLGPQFVDIARLVPGQTRFSLARTVEKVLSQAATGGFVDVDKHRVPAHDDGRATWPLAKAKRAVRGPGDTVVVLDGNHQVLASVLLGARTVPLDIVADASHLSPAAFWAHAAAQGWTYLNAPGGAVEPTTSPDYRALIVDPWRYRMTEHALKAASTPTGVVFEDESRLCDRVWLKVAGATVDFIEFRLADVVYRALAEDPCLQTRLAAGAPEVPEALRAIFQAAIADGSLDPQALGIYLLPAGTTLDDARMLLTPPCPHGRPGEGP